MNVLFHYKAEIKQIDLKLPNFHQEAKKQNEQRRGDSEVRHGRKEEQRSDAGSEEKEQDRQGRRQRRLQCQQELRDRRSAQHDVSAEKSRSLTFDK